MPPCFLWDARAEQNRGSLAGSSVPATPQPLTRWGRAGLRMDCDCDARGGREGDSETDSVQFNGGEMERTNERTVGETGGSLKKCS